MSLPYRQRRQLRRIEKTVVSAEPRLAAMLVIFARLAAGEAMPAWDRLHQVPPRPVRALARAALAVIRVAGRAFRTCRRACCRAALRVVAACPLTSVRVRRAARAYLRANPLHGSAMDGQAKR